MMDPNEVEFMGEKELVSIVPNFSFDPIHLISGSVGPFRAGLPVKVPIWLAINLKQQQKCRIISQEWMDVDNLNERKEEEKASNQDLMLEFCAKRLQSHFGYELCKFTRLICFSHIYTTKAIGAKCFFTRMPSDHYIDEAHMLLSVASDDIPAIDNIRTAVKDIWDIRMSKLRTSIDTFLKGDILHAKLDHLTAMEINSVRPLLPHALDQMLRIQMGEESERETQNSEHSQ